MVVTVDYYPNLTGGRFVKFGQFGTLQIEIVSVYGFLSRNFILNIVIIQFITNL